MAKKFFTKETWQEFTSGMNSLIDTLSNKADEATTLSGYGITDAYTKSETYSDSEIDTKVSELNVAISGKVPTSRTINNKALTANITLSASDVEADAYGSASSALLNAKSYTDSEIGKLSYYTESEIDSKVTTINDSISGLSTQVNNFLDVDDTTRDELSEVLTLIDNNRGDLQSLTTSKVNVSDIANNLTTNDATKVLSAAQGVAIQAQLDGKANISDIATTVMQGTATQNNTHWKISNFGNWGTGTWMQKGFSMLITSRAGEMVWVSLAANDSNTSAGAFRLVNRYSKIAALHYSVSESAIYVTAAAWANNICAHVISNVNGDYVPTVASASALPSDAVAINIVEFGINSTSAVVGDSSVLLEMGGSGNRPTYNGNNIALQSDIPTDYAPSSHSHDDRYYTESEIDSKFSGKVAKAGDTMTGRLAINMSNPHVHFLDTGYSTNWYIQAYEDQFGFGTTWTTAFKSDKDGNVTSSGYVKGSNFRADDTAACIRPSDSNEINIGSNANYIYFGYDNRAGSSGVVNTYNFGRSNGTAGATDGDIVCGSTNSGRYTQVGRCRQAYDSTNECLNFSFV